MTGIPASFKPVSAADSKRVIKSLHERGGPVAFKFPDSGVFKLRAEPRAWGENIMGRRPVTLGDGRRDEIAVANFVSDNEIYFFTAKVRLQKKVVHLEVIGELSRLARRSTRRLVVPASVGVALVTKRIGDRLVFLRGPVQDISAKGCRVSFHGETLPGREGQELAAVLRYGQRKPLEIRAIIRHKRKPKSSRYDQSLGLQFSGIEDGARFQTWLIDLHREVFALSRTPSI